MSNIIIVSHECPSQIWPTLHETAIFGLKITNFSLQTGTETSAVSLMSSTDASTTPGISHITGIYTFESEENFQNYLKKLGVPYVLRSLSSLATPVVTISKNCQVGGAF